MEKYTPNCGFNAILMTRPKRWKIMQALPVFGQNDAMWDQFMVGDREFQEYVRRANAVKWSGIVVVPEDNHAMTGSYTMVDPAGRFFDNVDGRHTYSFPILQVGVAEALHHVRIYRDRFEERGRAYDWQVFGCLMGDRERALTHMRTVVNQSHTGGGGGQFSSSGYWFSSTIYLPFFVIL